MWRIFYRILYGKFTVEDINTEQYDRSADDCTEVGALARDGESHHRRQKGHEEHIVADLCGSLRPLYRN
jgi:hypothetical protein